MAIIPYLNGFQLSGSLWRRQVWTNDAKSEKISNNRVYSLGLLQADSPPAELSKLNRPRTVGKEKFAA